MAFVIATKREKRSKKAGSMQVNGDEMGNAITRRHYQTRDHRGIDHAPTHKHCRANT